MVHFYFPEEIIKTKAKFHNVQRYVWIENPDGTTQECSDLSKPNLFKKE